MQKGGDGQIAGKKKPALRGQNPCYFQVVAAPMGVVQ